MSNEEAIAHGKEQLDIFGGEHREFIEVAIKAIEKQIPKKFIPITDKIWDLQCPTCGCKFSDEAEYNYCPICGQAMD